MNRSHDELGISLEEATAKIRRLENENRQLSRDLEDHKGCRFDILQQENDIPEQRVKEAFIRIFDGVNSWIDDVSRDETFDFKAGYAKAMQRANRRTLFRELGLESGCLEMPWAMKLGGLETCHYVVLSLAITHFIVTDVFEANPECESRDLFPPGISPEQRDLIKRVESVMGSDSNKVKGDKNRYSKWRGETISALTRTKEYGELWNEKTMKFDKDLKIDLEEWVDGNKFAEHFRSLRHKVLDPAYEFLHTVGCSGKTYRLCLERIAPGSIPPSDRSWNFKDMATWRMVSSSEVTGSIRSLYPGLVRKGYSGHRDLVLVKPVALGYRQLELQPQFSTPRPRTGNSSPVQSNNKSVEGTAASRSRGKALRMDQAQERPPHQPPRDQRGLEHRQPKIENSLLVTIGKSVMGPSKVPSSPNSRARPRTPTKNGGRQLSKLRENQKATM
ncbi:hypothetical protein O1611_g104 [Lasiodiplodia mahajangana]|uniref:Uncharacterized protein n=1 Tax=Lasiodiplodia mahajangana TaxID=1108764 RepID=A0ACC2K1G4_9PEZI|nr:hypothetical protein O1611_g104 [Lasiodiplodia mahajangana]